jgi:uncharacterized membrane protein YqjE
MEKLKETIFKFLRLDGLFNHLTGYVEARIELLKIEIREDIAKALANAMIYGVIFFFGFMFMAFFSVGLAHFLNRYFSQTYVGFAIVAGLYLVGFLIFMIFRKNILQNFEKHLTELIKRREHK